MRSHLDLPSRDPSADGLKNRFEAYVLSHFPWFWKAIMAVPPLNRLANRIIIDRAVLRAETRPSPLSSMAERGDVRRPIAGYTSWESLTDLSWFGRHLPPSDLGAPEHPLGPLPSLDAVEELFRVHPDGPTKSETSSVLLLSFAQWFTDGFLMTLTEDPRKTHSLHQIDFNTLYGLSRAESDAIRLMSEAPGERGRLKVEVEPKSGEAFAPAYFDEAGNPRPEFAALRPPLRLDEHLAKLPPETAAEVKRHVFAFAGERANTTPYTAMLNTLFLREHNRLAGLIEKAHPDWNDERVFQTARNVNVVLLIKIVIEEYINHLAPYHFQLRADPSVAWRAHWNKPNWMPIEFNLLYRWHSFTPTHFEIEAEPAPIETQIYNHAVLKRIGLGQAMQRASDQRAWNLGLQNTAKALLPVERASVAQGRRNQLASYNDYREFYGYGRVTRFDQITGDPDRQALLSKLYDGEVDKVEFFVGLFAEDVSPGAAVPPLIGRMVALDAFSQALPNPLLSEHVFNARTFSETGLAEINATRRLSDILHRNLGPDRNRYRVSFTLPAYRKG